MSDNAITITRKVGTFTFEPATPMGLCRLICDSVQGQMLNPKDRTAGIETVEQAHAFVKASDSLVLGGIAFGFTLSTEFADNRLDRALLKLAGQAHVGQAAFKKLADEFHMATYQIRQLFEAYADPVSV